MTSSPSGDRRPSQLLIAGGALLLLALLVFAPALRPGSVFYFRDISQNHVPYRQLTMDTLREGEAPLWNPLRGAGQPLLANPNALVLHPTTLLFFVLPVQTAIKASVILQVFLAALATWLLLRDIGAAPWARLIGAAAFAFTGPMLSLGNLLNLLDSAAFMPLTLWLAGRAVTRRFAPWGPLAAVSLAVQILAGEPALLICTALALAALHWSYEPSRRSLLLRGSVLASILLLALVLSMAGTLPTLELLSRSERGEGFARDEALKWSLPPAALADMLIPGFFGDPTRTALREFWGGGLFDAGLPFLLSLWIGPPLLILAGCGIVCGVAGGGRARLEAVALGGLATLAVALALGRHLPLYPALLDLAPPLAGARYPVKYILAAAWALGLLAARGYDQLARRAQSRPQLGAPAAALLAALVAIAATRWGFARHALAGWIGRSLPVNAEDAAAINAALDRSALWAAGMVIVAGVFVLYPTPEGRRLPRWGALAALAVMHIVVVVRINPVAPADFYTAAPRLALALGEPTGGRLWAQPRPPGFAFRTPTGAQAGSLEGGFRWDRDTLRNATYFPLRRRFAYDRGNERLDVMPGAALGRELAQTAREPAAAASIGRLLSLAGVDRAITYGGLDNAGLTEAGRLEGGSNVPVVVMANAGALPRAYVVHKYEVIPDMAAALRRIREPEFDPASTVVLDSYYTKLPTAATTSKEPRGEARIVMETSRHIRLECRAASQGWLVLLDTFYPGWESSIDGAPAPIALANAMFRAVPIPPGSHVVEFRYRPSAVRQGAIVSALGLLLCGFLAVPRSGRGAPGARR